MQHAEWEYLYKTTLAAQLPWELGGPDACLEELIGQRIIPSGGNVLDIGCGLGSAAVYLAAAGFRVTGIDISMTAIEKARAKAEHVGVAVDFQAGDVLTASLPSKAYDLVYDRGCLQHLAADQHEAYRKLLIRVLKTKGHYAVELAQNLMSLDDLRTMLGRLFTIAQVTSVTHVERPTGIPHYFLFVHAKRR